MSTLTEKDLATYTIDPAHSRVGFSVRHMGFARVRGSFEQFEGIVRMRPGSLESLEAEGTVQATSVTTSDTKRDEHLRSADFFEVDKHATITFRTTGVRDVTSDSFTLLGELSIRGVTQPIELRGTYLGEGIVPWGGTRVAFEATGKVNRKDFGLNWNTVLETGGFLVSDDVEITVEVQAVQQQD